MKNNVKRAWWKKFVQESPYNVGLDAAIIMNPQVWVASGHVTTFNDPLIDCKSCKMRHRADKLIEEWLKTNPVEGVNVEAMTNDEMVAFIRDHQVPCPGCGKSDFTDIRKFNLMFKTHRASRRTPPPRSISARDRPGHLRQLPPSSAPPAASCPSACARWASPSATRSPRATSSSASASSSRWSWSSSASPIPTWSGLSTGAPTATTGCMSLGMKDENLRLRDHEKEELSLLFQGHHGL
jgi:glycyl-tRNA synthetase